jgi:hypothetical protein
MASDRGGGSGSASCVSIERPGGYDTLLLRRGGEGTVGANILVGSAACEYRTVEGTSALRERCLGEVAPRDDLVTIEYGSRVGYCNHCCNRIPVESLLFPGPPT